MSKKEIELFHKKIEVLIINICNLKVKFTNKEGKHKTILFIRTLQKYKYKILNNRKSFIIPTKGFSKND